MLVCLLSNINKIKLPYLAFAWPKELQSKAIRMLADRLISPVVFIDFRLQIASCDCNISLSSVIKGSTAASFCGFTTVQCNYIHTSVIWLVSALVPMENANFWASYKMFNVTEDKSQSPRNIIEYCNTEKLRYDSYLAISVFKLLSSVVVVDVWLREGAEIFGRRWGDIRRSATIVVLRYVVCTIGMGYAVRV